MCFRHVPFNKSSVQLLAYMLDVYTILSSVLAFEADLIDDMSINSVHVYFVRMHFGFKTGFPSEVILPVWCDKCFTPERRKLVINPVTLSPPSVSVNFQLFAYSNRPQCSNTHVAFPVYLLCVGSRTTRS